MVIAFHFQAGSGEMEVDDKIFQVKAGTTVTVFPGEAHEIRFEHTKNKPREALTAFYDAETNEPCLCHCIYRNTGSENLVLIYFGIV